MTRHSALYEKLQKEFIQKWANCQDAFPNRKRQFSYLKKRIWEIKFDRFLKFTRSQAHEEHTNKEEVIKKVRLFFNENLDYSNEQLNFIFSDEMITASRDFIKKAWQFDANLGDEELFQALRNAWIMLSLQSLWKREVKTTPSVLAYSLLYPYTDNLIDDASICKQGKLDFCKRFASRLNGEEVDAKSDLERKIYDLVEMIEREYSRIEFPQIYESLLAIHKAQTRSLELVSIQPNLSETETLQICINKGATSVIADGYLVLGDLDEKQFHFLFEYGSFLQILDDIQDARQDYSDGIMTCFSRTLLTDKLDKVLCKTYFLGKEFYQSLQNLYPKEHSFRELTQRSFALLLVASVFQNQDDFSPELIQTIEKHAPFRFSFLRKRLKDLIPFQELLNKKVSEYKLSVTTN